MALLAGAIAVCAALTVLNLVLTAGVIQRLKEHAAQLGTTGSRNGLTRVEQPMPVAGTAVAPFVAETVDGSAVAWPPAGVGHTVVAFLTPTCPPCREELPRFLALAAAVPGGADAVLAVAIGDPSGTADLVRRLGDVAQVVREDHGGRLATMFGAQAMPTFCVLDPTGRVVAASAKVADLPAGVPA